MITVAVAGKPLYVLKRTKEQINALHEINEGLLDPNSFESQQPLFAANNGRSLRSDVFVGWGICTHLGCSVSHVHPNAYDFVNENFKTQGGFFCPCHGAQYDTAGRVYKNLPAQRNLDIPEYEFLDESTIIITDETAF